MTGPTTSRAAVVVVHWGEKSDTLACLSSVGASLPAPLAVIVVDNGTGALAPDEVTRIVPGADLVRLPENLGFAGGSNVGVRRALAAGAASVLLLNNDAVLDPDTLAELERVAARAQTAAVGAKVFSAEDPTRLWATYGRLTYRAALVELPGAGLPDGPEFAAVREVDWVPGCAMLLTREAIESIGLLDELFFAYHEDLDWCTSAREAGFKILFAPGARVVHRGGGSLAAQGPASAVRYLSARNTILFARKHAGAGDWLRLGTTITTSLARAWWQGSAGGDAVVRLLFRGYRDGLLGAPLPYRSLGLR
jgi:GT2 family glycosyltransferase